MAAKQTSRFPDVSILKQFAQSELIHALESLPGEKDLVLDPDILRPIDNFSGVSLLKKHGVKSIYKMKAGETSLPGCHQRMYVVRPLVVTMKMIADHVNNEKGNGEYRNYKILMVPRKLHACVKILENEGVLGEVELHACVKILENEGVLGEVEVDDLPITMFVNDTDLITLELPQFCRSFYLDGDETGLLTAADALLTIQQLFGRIPNLHLIGRAAHMVRDMMKYLEECKNNTNTSKDTHIGHLFIIDREVDFMTPLCSQVTYEGILDETFGIDNGVLDFKNDSGEDIRLVLSSTDEIYSQSRDRHFTNVFAFLSSKTKDLQSGYEKRHGLSVGEMKNFVGQELRGLQNQHKTITHHINASEIMMTKKNKCDFKEVLATERSIMEMCELKEAIPYIEECIHRQLSYHTTLRLLCLLSLTNGGIPTREFKSLNTQFLHSHGFEHMLTWHNLKKVGLLKEKVVQASSIPIGSLVMARKSPYLTMSKRLNLVPVGEIDLNHPTDMSYVFGGAYSPLTCSLVENGLMRHGYTGLEDAIKLLPGGVEVSPPLVAAGPRVVLVCFIGGCTYAETTALRFLSLKLGYQFIVLTTSMINGTSLIETLMERVNT